MTTDVLGTQTCAVVQLSDNVVVNKIITTNDSIAPEGCVLVSIDNIPCDIGWVWDGYVFVEPVLSFN